MGGEGSGRHPDPLAIGRALGEENALKRREVPVMDMDVECPEDMPEWGRRFWATYYDGLRASGVLGYMDVAVWGMACMKYHQWREAWQMEQDKGAYIPTKDKDGNVIGATDAPWARREERLFESLRRILARFGMDPVGRIGLVALVPEPEEIEDVT